MRRNKRYVPDYPADKASYYRVTHDGNMKVGMKALKAFGVISKDWNYEERTKDLHDEFHKYHPRNYIPRVVADYRKMSEF